MRGAANVKDLDDALDWLPEPLGAAAAIEVKDLGAPEVLASPGQLTQVVLNLVTNAIRASPPGTPLAVDVRIATAATGRAVLEVADRGQGIAPEILGRIFEPFFTTRPAGDERGSGLGLAVCHSIITAHGGTVAVQSEVGKGTTFTVELPAAPAAA